MPEVRTMTILLPALFLTLLIGSLIWSRWATARMRQTRPASPPETLQDTERRLAADLLAGKLDQTSYQQAMADLARRARPVSPSVETATLTGVQGDPRAQLAMLGTTLPELSPNVLCSAFVLAQHGADADALIHTLNLTKWQAATIVAGSRR